MTGHHHTAPTRARGSAVAALLLAAVLLCAGVWTAGAEAAGGGRSTVKALPERMQSTRGARQLVVITGRRLGARSGTLRLFDYEHGRWRRRLLAPATFGSKGLTNGLVRHEGSLTTPTGIWRMSPFAFGRHTAAPRGCGLAWRRIRSTSWWSSEYGASYNTWVETTGTLDGEHLIEVGAPYEYALHTGFNALPNERVDGRGSAIFIHVMHPGYTQGCIMLARGDMVALLRLLRSGRRLTCAIGTTAAGTPTSILAY
jgi:L,D-peptidoglycan transpeptidase YkuD (ErfK/YbiS/YcfS/YnhG family)